MAARLGVLPKAALLLLTLAVPAAAQDTSVPMSGLKLSGDEPIQIESDRLEVRDKENLAAGKETTIDRTLRLLYVTCSRAEESLALVLWAKDASSALTAIKACGWFAADEVVSLS